MSTTISTAGNYDQTLAQASTALDERIGRDGWPSDAERAKSTADALNDTWIEGVTVEAWVAAAASRLILARVVALIDGDERSPREDGVWSGYLADDRGGRVGVSCSLDETDHLSIEGGQVLEGSTRYHAALERIVRDTVPGETIDLSWLDEEDRDDVLALLDASRSGRA